MSRINELGGNMDNRYGIEPEGLFVGFDSDGITFYQMEPEITRDVLAGFEKNHHLRMAALRSFIFLFMGDEDDYDMYIISPIHNREDGCSYVLPVDRKLSYTVYLVEESTLEVCGCRRGVLPEMFASELMATCLDIAIHDISLKEAEAELRLLLSMYSKEDIRSIAHDCGMV